jgi:hypothetical protein
LPSSRAHDTKTPPPDPVVVRVIGVNGKRERVILAANGQLAFPDSDLGVQRAWAALGGDIPRPLEILNAWRLSRRTIGKSQAEFATVHARLPRRLQSAYEETVVQASGRRFPKPLGVPLNRSRDRTLIGINAALHTARYQTPLRPVFSALRPKHDVTVVRNSQWMPMVGQVVARIGGPSDKLALAFSFAAPPHWAHDVMGGGCAVIDGCFIYRIHDQKNWMDDEEVDAFRQYPDLTVRLERARVTGGRLSWLTEKGYDLPLPLPHDTNCDTQAQRGLVGGEKDHHSAPLVAGAHKNCACVVTGDAYAAR